MAERYTGARRRPGTRQHMGEGRYIVRGRGQLMPKSTSTSQLAPSILQSILPTRQALRGTRLAPIHIFRMDTTCTRPTLADRVIATGFTEDKMTLKTADRMTHIERVTSTP